MEYLLEKLQQYARPSLISPESRESSHVSQVVPPGQTPHLAPRSGRPNAVATAESGADGVGGEGWAAGEVFNKCGSQGDQGHPIENGWDLWFVPSGELT